MDAKQWLRQKRPEDDRLEYKSREVGNKKVAKELAAMSNADGGIVILGVREDDDGKPRTFEDIESTDNVARGVSDVLNERVEPFPDFNTESFNFEGKTLLALSVPSSDQLHSYYHERIEEPVFLTRRHTEIRYLSGHEVNEYFKEVYEEQFPDSSREELLRLPDDRLETQFDEYFIEAPDGHISKICLFSDIYHPGNPQRITMGTSYIPEERAEHILACLDAVFDISIGDAYFTINQSNGAWIGQGYYNFVSNLRSRDERYRLVRESGYDLDLYKHDQAVLVTRFGMVYPESTLLLYAAPFKNMEGYRYLNINFLISGTPTDIRPLIEFSERTKIRLNPSEGVKITSDAIQNPSAIPVKVVQRTIRSESVGENTHRSVDGAICVNPFFDNEEWLQKYTNISQPVPIANYKKLYAFLHHWDDPEDPEEYNTQQFRVYDWNEFAKSTYANVKEVRFGINW